MKRVFLHLVLATSMLLSAVGCDWLTNKTMAVGILTKLPDVTEAGLLDQRLLNVVGEMPIDQATLVTVFLGERASITEVVEPPTPILGANVELQWAGKSVELAEAGEGSYMAVNGNLSTGSTDIDTFQKPELEYSAGAPYSFIIDNGGEFHELALTAPEAIPAEKVTFTPALGQETITFPAQTGEDPLTLTTHTKGTALNLAWQSADPDKPQQAFITVARIAYSGSDMYGILDAANWNASGDNPVYDNFPRQPEEFLKLVLETPETSASVDGAIFTPGLYIMTMTVVELNTDNGMALGSAGLGGVATPFIFMVMP